MVARPLKLFAAASLASLAVGTTVALSLQAPITWVVDDDGGPGVDFTSLQTAIDAAGTGDLILVRPGDYDDFDLAKALTILGEPGARVNIGVVHDIADMTILAELEFHNLVVQDCTGTLVCDRLWGYDPTTHGQATILVEDSADVRLIEIDQLPTAYFPASQPQVTVRASRVEITSSYLEGRHGSNTASGYAGDGRAAVTVEEGGELHVSRTNLYGGDGGNITTLGSGYGGLGGEGLLVTDGDVLLTGRGAEVAKGGRGGSIIIYGYAGDGGAGARVKGTSSLRHSNVRLVGGKRGGQYASNGSSLVAATTATVKQPKFPDPVLERVGDPLAGSTLALKIRSRPGSYARLFWGFSPTINPTPGVLVDGLVVKEATIPVGFVPANGILQTSFDLDPSLPTGTTLYFQAMAIYPGGKIRRTNSVPVVVR